MYIVQSSSSMIAPIIEGNEILLFIRPYFRELLTAFLFFFLLESRGLED